MSDMPARRAQGEPTDQEPAQTEIIAGVAAGERWAHARLYDLLYPVVARTLQKILHDAPSEYEDLVQASFERIVRTLVAERSTPITNLPGWAGSIAAHVALDALRARIRERKLFDRNESSTAKLAMVADGNAEHRIEARRRLEWLQGALARMNQDQAETIVLHDVLGHDLAEIAVIMGVTVAAAQRRLSRGHQELLKRARPHAKESR